MTKKQKETKKEIIQPVSLSEAAKDHEIVKLVLDPSIISSPATSAEALPASSNSAKIKDQLRKITFLRNRIISDYSEIKSAIALINQFMMEVKSADYYLKEGIESLKAGVGYLEEKEEEAEVEASKIEKIESERMRIEEVKK